MMNTKPLMGLKVAVLVANGFSEQDVTTMQRKLQEKGATIRMVAMEDHGLAHSWNGTGWGLHFAGDVVLKSALAVDFDMLVVPGGQRSIEKLKLTEHTKRFIKGFLNAHKPVAAMGKAVDLLLFAGSVAERTVSGPESLKEEVEAQGGTWSSAPVTIDQTLVTGRSGQDQIDAFTDAVVDHFVSCYDKGADINQAA